MSTLPHTVSEAARRDAGILALACSGSFVVIMDATIVPVALPDVRVALGFAPASLPWVVNAYTLAFAGFLLLGGRCADVFGHRRMFLTGTVVFTVARVCCGWRTHRRPCWPPGPCRVSVGPC